MRENLVEMLSDYRQLIHDLTMQKRSTGLSPPEEELLLQMEAQEIVVSSEDKTIIEP